MVRTELGEAPAFVLFLPAVSLKSWAISAFSRTRTLTPGTLDSCVEFASAEFLVAGQYARFGNAIRLEASLRNTNGTTVPLTAEAATDGDIPVAVKALVQSLREKHLGCTAGERSGYAVRSLGRSPHPWLL